MTNTNSSTFIPLAFLAICLVLLSILSMEETSYLANNPSSDTTDNTLSGAKANATTLISDLMQIDDLYTYDTDRSINPFKSTPHQNIATHQRDDKATDLKNKDQEEGADMISEAEQIACVACAS
ncbi:hypothetical protein OLMES_3409 [Oleiphilus messinensis]|uniref:Uncharacterized protein n=1 Tax=Oleiphilus messinensis TaxID=141451 RepID=A0A1Y0IA99_9GAMM|nr:hypothetical protein [Oleiphilus messinensis]ARU57447.1 hypothetical protein OLMES_3409 [Oleiphilus messinensis]